MATLQTNPMHDQLCSDDEPITDLQTGNSYRPGAAGGFANNFGGAGGRPVSLPVSSRDNEDVGQSWTGGLSQGCAPVFQPFGSPSMVISKTYIEQFIALLFLRDGQ